MWERKVGEGSHAHYISRGMIQYKSTLFPDSLFGVSGLDFIFALLLKSRLQQVHGDFKYWPASNNDTSPTNISLVQINAKFGGQREFFKKGMNVLDLGCGIGNATAELSQFHPGINFVGLDLNSSPVFPQNGNYTKADWNFPPFKNSSFERILSLESFPTHAEFMPDAGNTFKEISRIAAIGAIWRGTHRGVSMSWNGEPTWLDLMVTHMRQYGWELAVGNRTFMARLKSK